MSEINQTPEVPDATADAPLAIATLSTEVAQTDPNLICTLRDGTKVKRRLLRMRVCNERDAKDKLCAGHLKRAFRYSKELSEKFGASAELYRCDKCHTIYLPHPDDPGTGILSF